MKYLDSKTRKRRKWRYKTYRIFVNGYEVQMVRRCKLGLRGWVDVIERDEKGLSRLSNSGNSLRIKRIKNVFVEAVVTSS